MTSDTRPFHIGLLGCGTVGSAFAELVDERASEVERLTGRRPLVSGVLTRSRGDAQEILAGADLIVEVMGGVDPTREYVVAALRSGTPVVTANKQLLSRHGPELWEAAATAGRSCGSRPRSPASSPWSASSPSRSRGRTWTACAGS